MDLVLAKEEVHEMTGDRYLPCGRWIVLEAYVDGGNLTHLAERWT